MPITSPRHSTSHARLNESQPPKLASAAVFASRVSLASPEGIRENGFCAGNSRQGVTVDGNGNVRALVKADSANPIGSGVVERYAYDGFGRELASSTSVSVRVNSFAFSTKYAEPETGMNYYGYRFYAANVGRWINRDPIAENGGNNIYCVNCGNFISGWDYAGLYYMISATMKPISYVSTWSGSENGTRVAETIYPKIYTYLPKVDKYKSNDGKKYCARLSADGDAAIYEGSTEVPLFNVLNNFAKENNMASYTQEAYEGLVAHEIRRRVIIYQASAAYLQTALNAAMFRCGSTCFCKESDRDAFADN